MPMHTLVTYMVDSQGGSALVVKFLNHLGVCASADTLLWFIQFKASSYQELRKKYSNTDSFLLVSADKLTHSYAQVFSGNQQNSWHGTTIQLANPLPSVSDLDVCITCWDSHESSRFASHTVTWWDLHGPSWFTSPVLTCWDSHESSQFPSNTVTSWDLHGPSWLLHGPSWLTASVT